MKNFWSFKKEYKILNKVILKSIDKSLNSENIFFGNQLEKFEKEFNKLNKSKFGLAVGSGTEALYIALKCFNIGYGDEVITVSNSAIPTVSAINSVGAKATFVDIKSDYLIDPEKIKKKINKKTKAIIPVHLYGHPCEMDKICRIANKYNLKIIEDCAQAQGATIKNKYVGTFGDAGCFSFYPTKQITTGEGGMVVMNDPDLFARCLSLRNLCFQAGKRFVHEELGWNMRMTNIQAALGVAQLEKIEATLRRKRFIGEQYQALLSNLEGIELPLSSISYAENNYWVFGIVLNDDIPTDANYVMSLLSQEQIGTRPFFWSMHEQPVLTRLGLFEADSHPVSERISRRGFYIPSGLAITKDQIYRVASVLTDVMKKLSQASVK